MTVGIVGLGLIGGSFAKAYAEAGETVFGSDRDRSTLEFACMSGAVAEELTEQTMRRCDLLLLAVPPKAAVEWLRTHAAQIAAQTVVLDCCGTKRAVCEACFAIAREHGVTYLGAHPMAGTHRSGFKYARGNLFHGAPMVVVPPDFEDVLLLERVEKLLRPAGFGRFTFTTAQEHDERIAYTSQLAHIVSNAYVKSPTAAQHRGFSAGSYKDLTRVAWLDAAMWAELCMENRDHLTVELDGLIERLGEYRAALAQGEGETLRRLLAEGRDRKEEVDGR